MAGTSAGARKAWITRHLGAGVPRGGTKSDYRLALRLQSKVNPRVKEVRLKAVQTKLAARSLRRAGNRAAYTSMMMADVPPPIKMGSMGHSFAKGGAFGRFYKK